MAVPVAIVPYDGAHAYGGEDAPGSGTLLDYWYILRRRKALLLITALAGAGLAALLTLPQTPMYRATSSLEILSLNENFMNIREVDPTAGSYSEDSYIHTQVRILQSRSLAERVYAKLNKGPHSTPPAVHASQPDSGFFHFMHRESGNPREIALQTTLENITIRTPLRTRVVEITCDSTDPTVASDFANTLATEFIDQSLEARWDSTRRTREWLKRQLDDVQVRLSDAEKQLQSFTEAQGLSLQGSGALGEDKLRKLQDELGKAQADRVAKQSRYELARQSPPDAVPEMVVATRDYELKLEDLQRQYADLGETLTPEHYRMQELKAQIGHMRVFLERRQKSVLEQMHSDFEQARRREDLLTSSYAEQGKKVVDESSKIMRYNFLKREVDSNRQVYDLMSQKVKEAGIASAMIATNIRIVDTARPPKQPFRPSPVLNGASGLTAGLLIAIVVVIARDKTNNTLRSPGQTATCLDIPELGVIPPVPRRRHLMPRRWIQGGAGGCDRNGGESPDTHDSAVESRPGEELVTWNDRYSVPAESFRNALTSIMLGGGEGERRRVIVVTSARPREGKTLVTANLGAALAEVGRRTLLIDADLRRPALHDVFSLPNSWGVSDLLRSDTPFQDCPLEALVRETAVPNLELLPAGPGALSIAHLLYSPRLIDLLARFRKEFEMILIDTPPAANLQDARILGRLSDGVVLVVRAGRTNRETASAIRNRLAGDSTPVLGTILNDCHIH